MKNIEFMIMAYLISGTLYGGYLIRLLLKIKSTRNKKLAFQMEKNEVQSS